MDVKHRLIGSAVLALALLAGVVTVLAQTNLAPASPAEERARIRFIHASPDAPAVNVGVDGSEVFTATAFGDITNYAAVTSGTHLVAIQGPGGALPIVSDTLVFTDGDYTLAAVGTLTTADTIEFELVTFLDDNSAPDPGMARGRLVHLSPGGPAVDVAIEGGDILFSNVSYKGAGDYVQIAAGTYNLEIRLAGTPIVLGRPPLTVRPNNVYTVFAIGNPASIQFVQTLDRAHGHTLWLPLIGRSD